MYSLYVVAGQFERSVPGGPSSAGLAGDAALRVTALLPDVKSALRVETLDLPEIGGGWATISPVAAIEPVLIQQHVDDRLAVLVFGQIDASRDPARSVERAFRSGGHAALQRLSGVFSAVIVDRRQRQLSVFTSVPGCRSLRYVTSGSRLFLSTLDAGLVALAGLEVEIDLEAVAGTVACGWAIGGCSPLRRVEECSGLEHLIWCDGKVERRRSTLLGVGRLDARDTAAIDRKVEEVIEELHSGVGEQLRYTDPDLLGIALTAGVDSRAALSLVLSQRERSTIESYTRGDPNTRDVRVARAVSARLGIRHRLVSHEQSLEGPIATNLEFVAMSTNGASSVERALSPAFAAARTPPALGGGGGEIFRGFYYNYIRRRGGRVDATGVADALLASPLWRAKQSRFADPALSSAPERLVRAAVSALEIVSRDAYDLTDLFYLIERFSRWASFPWRCALGPTLVPFANTRAILAAFQLPAPLGDHALIARAIERHAPSWLYWTPINGFELLALEGPGAARYLAREGLRGGGKILRRLTERRLRLHAARLDKTPQLAAAAYFAQRGFDFMHGLLLAPDSVARDVLSTPELERRIASHRRSMGELPILGALMTVEVWRRQLREVKRTSSSLAPTPGARSPT